MKLMNLTLAFLTLTDFIITENVTNNTLAFSSFGFFALHTSLDTYVGLIFKYKTKTQKLMIF